MPSIVSFTGNPVVCPRGSSWSVAGFPYALVSLECSLASSTCRVTRALRPSTGPLLLIACVVAVAGSMHVAIVTDSCMLVGTLNTDVAQIHTTLGRYAGVRGGVRDRGGVSSARVSGGRCAGIGDWFVAAARGASLQVEAGGPGRAAVRPLGGRPALAPARSAQRPRVHRRRRASRRPRRNHHILSTAPTQPRFTTRHVLNAAISRVISTPNR